MLLIDAKAHLSEYLNRLRRRSCCARNVPIAVIRLPRRAGSSGWKRNGFTWIHSMIHCRKRSRRRRAGVKLGKLLPQEPARYIYGKRTVLLNRGSGCVAPCQTTFTKVRPTPGELGHLPLNPHDPLIHTYPARVVKPQLSETVESSRHGPQMILDQMLATLTKDLVT